MRILIVGLLGTGFWIDWGDGSAWQWVTHVGTSTNVTTTHTYANVGTKYQRWIGELHKIAYVSIHSQSYSFNIASFSYMTALTVLSCAGCPLLTGNISAFSPLTALTSLICYNCPLLTGNISACSPLNALTVLSCTGCPLLTGNISAFSPLNALTVLGCNGCPLLTGNISAFSSLPALTSLICYDITNLGYTTATLPIWVNTVLRFDNTGLSTAEVDQIILDVNAVGKSGGSLNVAGTSNGPYTRGGAVAAAIVALTGRGCPVTAN